MKKQHLLKTMLLLCALVVGSSNLWADNVTLNASSGFGSSYGSDHTFTVGGIGFKDSGVSYNAKGTPSGFAVKQVIQMRKSGSGAGTIYNTAAISTITTVQVTLVNNNNGFTLYYGTSENPSVNSIASSSLTPVTGSFSYENSSGTTSSATSYTFTFNLSSYNATYIKIVNGSSANYVGSIVINYEESSTFSVSYNKNGATSGTAPTDPNSYSSGDEVTVLDNTGSLAKTSCTFGGWNTESDGTGTNYTAGDKFNITANTTLYAKWIFAISDGVYDFQEAAAAGADYGSGIEVTTNGSYYDTDESTWTAGNVTMVVSGKYRWWQSSGPTYTLRFYGDCSSAFSVPTGYVITKIVSTGGNFSGSNTGTLSGDTWTGAAQNVTLSTTENTTFSKFTVTYTTANQSITPGYAKTTYVTPYKMNFSGVDGLKAYVATAANASGVTMTSVDAAVPENTPLLLVGTAGTTYNVPVAASATTPETNLLEEGDGTTEFDGTTYDYILYSDGKFYQIGSGTVAVGKAYLHLDSKPSGAHALDIVFEESGDVTGIREIVNEQQSKANGQYFNLAGQRVNTNHKGIVIVNGKKYFNK